jgi:hypothetical protein
MTLRRGLLRVYTAATKTADVELADAGGHARLAGIPVSRGIPDAEMVPGRLVVVAELAAEDPAGAMVVGVW